MKNRGIKLIGSIVFYLAHTFCKQVAKIIGLSSKPTFVILYYHNIKKEEKASFSWQMDALIRCGLPVLAGTDNPPKDAKRLIAVTFDDGFVSAVHNALPILLERKIPVTIFIPTSYIGKCCSWINKRTNPDHKEPILSSEEIRNLTRQGVAIGSHSVSHRPMTALSESEVWRELTESKHELELITSQSIDMVSFPHGKYTREIANLAKSAGYRHGFTIVPQYATTNAKEFLRGRIEASPTDSQTEFWLKLRGAYCWLAIAQKIKRQLLRLLMNPDADAREQRIGSK